MSEHVTVYEVGPRDGLQNEPGFVPTADKIALIDLLSARPASPASRRRASSRRSGCRRWPTPPR